MDYIQGADRHQTLLFPPTLGEYVSADNPVRFIDLYVDQLDLVNLGFTHARLGSTGRPQDLLKLYMYGYLHKIRSSRGLERETHRNIELMWLLGKLQPGFKTIADFRKNNTDPLKAVCGEFIMVCKQLGLFGGELVGIDGSKFEAVNHSGRSYTRKGLEQLDQADWQAKAVLGVEALEVVADKGYYNELQMVECEASQICCYIPAPKHNGGQTSGIFSQKDFTYDSAVDGYQCPAGQRLTYKSTVEKNGKRTRIYETSACQGCPLRSRCTTAKAANRQMCRWIHKGQVEAIQARLRDNPKKIAQRSQLAEHPFGTLKRAMGHGYFLTRGIQRVSTEMSLSVLAYNMKRVLTIIGTKKLMEAIQLVQKQMHQLFAHFWQIRRKKHPLKTNSQPFAAINTF